MKVSSRNKSNIVLFISDNIVLYWRLFKEEKRFKMGSADWSIAAGILTFIIAIIFATIYYLRYKKIFLIVLIASIATYMFSVFYIWDVFDLNKNWIMLILIISTVLMILLGKYFQNLN